jgi:hypothetical protein
LVVDWGTPSGEQGTHLAEKLKEFQRAENKYKKGVE